MALSPEQETFLNWLVEPSETRMPLKQNEWCRQNDLPISTVASWKKQKEFVEAWRTRADEEGIGPMHIISVRDAMYKKAQSGDVRAAEIYYKFAKASAPYLFAEPEDPEEPVESMSDEELDRALEE